MGRAEEGKGRRVPLERLDEALRFAFNLEDLDSAVARAGGQLAAVVVEDGIVLGAARDLGQAPCCFCIVWQGERRGRCGRGREGDVQSCHRGLSLRQPALRRIRPETRASMISPSFRPRDERESGERGGSGQGSVPCLQPRPRASVEWPPRGWRERAGREQRRATGGMRPQREAEDGSGSGRLGWADWAVGSTS